jgi:ATP-binding cassette subfamily C protein LapB
MSSVLFEGPALVVYLTFLGLINASWLLQVLLGLVVMSLVGGRFARTLVALSRDDQERIWQRDQTLQRMVKMIENIKGLAAEETISRRYLKFDTQVRTTDLSRWRSHARMSACDWLVQCAVLLALLASVDFQTSPRDVLLPSIVVVVALVALIFRCVTRLQNAWFAAQRLLTGMQSLDEVFMLKQELDDDFSVTHLALPHGYFIEHAIVHVGEETVLNLRHLDIQSGERVLVMGDAKSGKTAFLKLLAGLYQPHKGHVLLGMQDMALLDRELLTRGIAYLPAHHHLIDASLRENLMLGLRGVTPQKLAQRVHEIGLLDGLIQSHPMGLEQPLCQTRHPLSVQDVQLIALTRLILRQPHIWLLDEPLQGMDVTTQIKVVATLKAHMSAQSTWVMVSSHQTLMRLAERVLMLERGQIVQDNATMTITTGC